MSETIQPVLHEHMIVCVLLTFPVPRRKSRIEIHMIFCTYVRTIAQEDQRRDTRTHFPLTGWSMSPGLDSFAPWLPSIFGGRQGARLVHFVVTANLLVLFVLIHLLAVVAAGLWNELRSMITGRFVIRDGD
jgi:hypothetical protein